MKNITILFLKYILLLCVIQYYKFFFPIQNAFLNVLEGAPQFQSKFLVLSTRRGDRCVIECFPKGDRPLSFSWKRGGKVLDAANEPR